MSREYFDWKTIEEDIVVPEQAAIAVYTNPAGAIVLRQAGQYGPEEDTIIVVQPSHAMALASALLDRAGIDMAIVHVGQLRIQNGGGELLQPFPDQATVDAVNRAGRAAELDDNQDAADEAEAKDRTAAERQRRRREKHRQRDTERDITVTERDTERDTVTSTVTSTVTCRDNHRDERDNNRDNNRDTVTVTPLLVPEFDLDGGQSRALAH
jgi:hypothetical protein